jgi:hypothetical protein
MTIETINARSVERHTHESGSISVDEALCPTCDQPVSPEKFEQIQVRIEGEERARAAKIERTLQARFAGEMAKVEATKKAEVEKARKDAAAQIEKAKREVAAREVAIRQEATKAATAVLAPKIAEAVNSEKQRSYAEKLKLTEQLDDMKRRLEKKTAGELGDEAEIDLFEALKREFTGDQITRIAKGVPGADIIHRVVHNSAVCGTLIYDCKNRKRWQNRFTAKLREDQLAEEADHAVLVAAVFPAGMSQLGLKDGVIIAAPQRVIALAHLLRRLTIQMHVLRLGNEARVDKTERLYAFMTSDQATQVWDQIAQATNGLEALENSEKSAHARVWARRADLHHAVKASTDALFSQIDRIISGTEASR